MVEFKTLKFKHQVTASEIVARRADGEAIKPEQDAFVMSLVADWDYVDIETGQPIPPGEPEELTIEQYNDVIAEFNRQMSEGTGVKKASNSNASSGLISSKRANRAIHPTPPNG